MFVFSYLAVAFALCCFALAAFVFYKRPKNHLAAYLACMIIGSGIWALSNGMADFAQSKGWGVVWSGLAVISFLFLTSCFLSFVSSFSRGGRPPPALARLIFFLPTIILSLFAFSHFSTVDIIVLGDRPSQTVVGPLYIVGPIFLYIAFIFSYVVLLKRYRQSTLRERRQTIYIVAGSFFLLAGLTVFDIVLPLAGELRFFSVGPLSTAVMIGSISYAIFKHELMDIKAVIQRGLIFTVLLALVVGFYLCIVFFLGMFLQKTAQFTALLGAGVTTVAGVFTVPRVERYFRKVTDRIFFKGKYDYGEAMHELSEVLHRSIDLTQICSGASDALKKILKAESVTFSFPRREDEHAAQEEVASYDGGSTLRVSVALQGRPTATLTAGRKRSGDSYTDEDRRLLSTFSHHAAVAIERAKLYEKVKTHSRELEMKVRQRTAQIAYLQKEQEQMMIDVSHGLQTPLTVVKGELGSLRTQMPGNKRLAACERSIDRISKFIYDLLHLARLGVTDSKKEDVNMSSLLEELAEYFAVLGSEQEIMVRASITPNIILYADRQRLEELVTNLVSNAFKWMSPDRKRIVRITLRRMTGQAVLTVEDTGVGIRKKDMPKIFDRFYRVKDEVHAHAEGTGVGLAIVKRIVERHGGVVSVTSKWGKGTRVTVKLPLLFEKRKNTVSK